MTIDVRVSADVNEDEEVKISIHSESIGEAYTLKQGEVGEYSVHDDSEIAIKKIKCDT